jgi:hypothetical protein
MDIKDTKIKPLCSSGLSGWLMNKAKHFAQTGLFPACVQLNTGMAIVL